MLQVPFHDVEQGVLNAKAEAAARAIKLADAEHQKTHDTLVVNKTNVTAALHDTRKDLSTLEKEIRECKIRVGALEVQERSAAAAVDVSSRRHHSYTAGFRTHPYPQHQPAAAPATVAPPPPRASDHVLRHTRPTKDPPVEWSDPPATWAAVTSRRPLQNALIPTGDSYLDVRVSSLRHHNWDFPTASRDAIFVLATTTHKDPEDVGRSKASLRFALDLALKTPSLLSADIVNDTIELCDLVRNMYNARYSPNWFSEHIKKASESCPRNRQVDFDSSASDRSVEARQQRHRGEPTSGRGKSKRVMTALTTDSDTGPDSPGAPDRGK